MSQHQSPLGTYFVEAGLITPAQVAVALNDQILMNHMRFGEVLVARGWIKQQTLDYVIRRVIEPERKAVKASHSAEQKQAHLLSRGSRGASLANDTWGNDRKALPSLPSGDGVSWVG
ncbi:hypothetical protein [Myxacorys almedinensis]|uniref:Uncharacterized protein n=1 Tax=Myxacorys almedinensis A TaxID=2690445 RepID=A0A8J8CHE3_9CYAN|nr:hypothetical protein [Myxacorys almedinensis]NDJ16623.1 hypothetical protein [Myxacorys almedinensis A]